MRRFGPALMLLIFALALPVGVFAQEDDQVSPDAVSNAHSLHLTTPPRGHQNGQDHARFGLAGIDSIANWNQHFTVGVLIPTATRSTSGITAWWGTRRNLGAPQCLTRRSSRSASTSATSSATLDSSMGIGSFTM